MSDKNSIFPKREERTMYGERQTQTRRSAKNNENLTAEKSDKYENNYTNENSQLRRSRANQNASNTGNYTNENSQLRRARANQNTSSNGNYTNENSQLRRAKNNQQSNQQNNQPNIKIPQERVYEPQNTSTRGKFNISNIRYINKVLNIKKPDVSSKVKKINIPNIKINLTKRQKNIGILGFLIFMILFMLFRKNGTEVFIDDVSFGILKSTSTTADDIIEMTYTQLEHDIGTEVKVNESITTKKLRVKSNRQKDYCTLEYLIPQIRNNVSFEVNSANILINSTRSVSLATEEDANYVLSQIQEEFLPENMENITVGFVEDVRVQVGYVPSENLMTTTEAIMALQVMDVAVGEYKVVSGDTWSGLAIKYSTSIEDLLSYNEPRTVMESPIVGETINVPVSRPKLSVKTVETQYVTTVEPKSTEYEYDNTLSKDYQKVKQQGRAGQKVSTIEVVRINSLVESEEEVSKEITVEPITEIIVRGTQ